MVGLIFIMIARFNKLTLKRELRNCEKYFDGCNICSVRDGELVGCTEMACSEYKEAKCVRYKIIGL